MAVAKGFSAGLLFLRLLCLTGVFVAAGGGLAWYLFRGDDARWSEIGMYVAWGGLAAVGLTLLIEIPKIFGGLSSRRGAVGVNVVAQIALAFAVVGGINVFTFVHYKRFDLTWDQSFTLKPELREQLVNLRGETDIVVVQRNLSSGLGGDSKPDRYDIAAPKKIVEKVKDLAEQFSDLGPRFRVKTLDIQDDDFDKKVKAIRTSEEEAAKARGETPSSPLADAIESSTENNIFFKANGAVQRLAFHDVYQIDKAASEAANHKNGNLVMNFQGVEPFARKILNIEEKKPRLSLAVVHPALSMTSRDHPLLTMNGAKKALESQGFVANDILLRKQDGDGGLSQEAAAETFDESRFEQIEEILPTLEERLAESEKALALTKKQLDIWKNQSLAQLQKQFIYLRLPNGQEVVATRDAMGELERRKIAFQAIPVDEEDRANETRAYQRDASVLERAIEEGRKERDILVKERSALNVDDLAEKKRIADVETKMKRMLADTDLLVIPRFTFHHLPSGQVISNKVHKLDEAQLRAMKAFMKEGKPVLFLLGPANEQREAPPDLGGGGDDALEPLLAELGFRLPKQTVLYNAEVKEFTERRRSIGFSQRELELPQLLLDWEAGAGQVNKKKAVDEGTNPLRVSLGLLDRSLGGKLSKELQIRHPRPVYVEVEGKSPGVYDEAAVFLMTGPDAWNENSPFINEKREAPRFTPTKDDDKAKGTLDEVRRGPFPIAVAVERTLPKKWFAENEKAVKARIGVIGNGGIFVGAALNPVKEKLLLDVTNWLLGRDDLLAKQQETWSYPRVELSEPQKMLWTLGTFVGLPFAFLYMGLAVWLVRRLR
ncbi:MAG: hypothetical protein WCL32_03680 [Planctomycetota bacterium]